MNFVFNYFSLPVRLLVACSLTLVACLSAAQDGVPKIQVNTPSGTPVIVCLQSEPAAIVVQDDDIFLEVNALGDAVDDFGCPEGPQVTINTFVVSPVTVEPGENITFSLQTNVDAGAISPVCEITGPPDTIDPIIIDDLIPGNVKDDIRTVPLSANAPGGLTTFTVICDPGANTAQASLTVDAPEPPAVITNAFSVSPTSGTPGTAITFVYNVTVEAGAINPQCVINAPANTLATNPLPVTDLSPGTNTVGTTILSSATQGTSFIATLNCTPNNGAAPFSTSFMVQPIDVTCPNPDITLRDLSSLGTDNQTGQSNGDGSLFSPPFNSDFPGPGGSSTEFIRIQTNRYRALEFNTNTIPAGVTRGSYTWGKGGAGTLAPALVSYSVCMGQFTDLADPSCVFGGTAGSSTGTINWHLATDPNPPTNSCLLQPNTQYFLNIAFAIAATPTSTTCPATSCSHLGEAGGLDP